MAEGDGADDRLQRPGRAESMAGGALGGTAWRGRTEHAGDGPAFRPIVAGGAGAVQIDVVDVAGLERRGRRARPAWRAARRDLRDAAPTCGRHRSIRRCRAAARRRRCSSGTRSSSANAAASPMEMPSRATSNGRQGAARCELQGMKAVQGGKTQRVHAAHQRRVDESCLDHAACRAEHLGAGGARTGNRHRRSLAGRNAAECSPRRRTNCGWGRIRSSPAARR